MTEVAASGAPGVAPPTAPPAGGQPAAAPEPKTLDAKEGLSILSQLGKPVVGQGGDVFVKQKGTEQDGQIYLRYVKAAKIDANGRMMLDPDFLAQQQLEGFKEKAKPIEQDGQLFWQGTVKGADGQPTTKLVPMTPAEQQSLQKRAAAQKQQQEMEAWYQDRQGWISKLFDISGTMRSGGYAAQLVDRLSAGPNAITGAPGAGWRTGLITAQILDNQTGGKLLPKFMTQGPVQQALDFFDFGLQILDTVPQAEKLAQQVPLFGKLTGLSTAAAGAAGIANPAAAPELLAIGKGLSSDAIKFQGTTNVAFLHDPKGLIPNVARDANNVVQVAARDVGEAMKATAPQLSKTAETASKITGGVDNAVHGTMASLRPAIGPVLMGASVFSAFGSAIHLNALVKVQGAKQLVDSKQGRGAVVGMTNSALMLGGQFLPFLAANMPKIAVASPAISVATTAAYGLSLLNNAGLFGGGGWLDRDIVRGAFLIPPLSPVGLAALWMKRREKQDEAAKKQDEAYAQQAVAKLAEVEKQAEAQIAQGGTATGAKVSEDGTIMVPTGIDPRVPTQQKAETKSATSQVDERQMQLANRPMRR